MESEGEDDDCLLVEPPVQEGENEGGRGRGRWGAGLRRRMWVSTRTAPQMTARDFLQLSAYEKWRKYGRMPWKFLLAIVIVSCTTANILLTAEKFNPYRRAVEDQFQTVLAPNPGPGTYTPDSVGYRKTHYFITTEAFLSSLNKSLDFYFTAPDSAVSYFRHIQVNSTAGNETSSSSSISVEDDVPLTVMSVTRYMDGLDVFQTRPNRATTTVEYPLTPQSENPLGPFTQAERGGVRQLQELVHSLKRVSLLFRLKGYDLQSELRQCYEWETVADYHFELRGQMTYQIHTRSMSCGVEEDKSYKETTTALLITLVAACVISQILHLRSLWKSIQLYRRLRGRAKAYAQSHRAVAGGAGSELATPAGERASPFAAFFAKPLRLREVLRFTNKWQVIELLCNGLNITVGCSLLLAKPGNGIRSGVGEGFDGGDTHSAWPWWSDRGWGLMEALSVFLSWVKLMEFFDQDSSYYVLFSALESGLPRLVAVMLRFLPLFIGYALLGMLLFGSCTDLFKNLDAACVTLFSVSNGDSIEDVFQTVDTCGDPALSRFYMYSIVGLNICVVLNILLVVVEDAFFATKAFQMDQRRIQREQEAENMHLVQWLDQKTPGDTESSGDEDEEKGWGMENALSGREDQNWGSSKLTIEGCDEEEEEGGENQFPPYAGSSSGASSTPPTHVIARRRRTTTPPPGMEGGQGWEEEGEEDSRSNQLMQQFSSSARSVGHARNRKKKLMDWRLSQSSRHVPSSHTSSPRMSASLAASDVKSRMQLLRRKSFKQMFRLKAREKLRMPLKDTTPKGSRSEMADGSAGAGSPVLRSQRTPGYEQKLQDCIAHLTQLLGDFTEDLRSELHIPFTTDETLLHQAAVLATLVRPHKPRDELCGARFCLQCALRATIVARARRSKHTFVRMINKVKKRSIILKSSLEEGGGSSLFPPPNSSRSPRAQQ